MCSHGCVCVKPVNVCVCLFISGFHWECFLHNRGKKENWKAMFASPFLLQLEEPKGDEGGGGGSSLETTCMLERVFFSCSLFFLPSVLHTLFLCGFLQKSQQVVDHKPATFPRCLRNSHPCLAIFKIHFPQRDTVAQKDIPCGSTPLSQLWGCGELSFSLLSSFPTTTKRNLFLTSVLSPLLTFWHP